MKFRTKYLLLALLMLIILILIIFVCLKLGQHHQNNDGSSVAVSNSEDDTISDDEGEQIIEEEKDPRLRELENDAWEYLMRVSAEKNIDLGTKEGVSIGAYYDYRNVLEIRFFLRDCSTHDRIQLYHDVAYYIQDWINANYSDEELPLYTIECNQDDDNWSMLVEGYIDFANFDCTQALLIKDQKPAPARSMYCVNLQVNYTEENYEGLSFDGITFLCTSHGSNRMMEDYSVLKHFPDLERVRIPMLISKTDEEIEAFIEEIKQYLPPDCEIEIDQY